MGARRAAEPDACAVFGARDRHRAMNTAARVHPVGGLASAPERVFTLAANKPAPPPQWLGFARSLEAATGQPLPSPAHLHEFSVRHAGDFWRHFLSWAELHWEGSAARVCDADVVAPPTLFPACA